MNSIERVAKAIYVIDRDRGADAVGPSNPLYFEMASAALKAMAEPTPEMRTAGMRAIEIYRSRLITNEEIENIWRAMHAAMVDNK
jgi:hypothetical protein